MMNSSSKQMSDREDAVRILEDIAAAANRNASLIRRGMMNAQDMSREIGPLEERLSRLRGTVRTWMRGHGSVRPPQLHVVASAGACDRCRSTRSEPCGRGGRRCIDCGWTYGAD
jgi:hypothetical protein